jgi:hypothetical protein
MRVELAFDEKRLRVMVTDDGCAATVPHIRDAPDESGRGLRIVEAYADAWGVERRGVGHAVWFSIGNWCAQLPDFDGARENARCSARAPRIATSRSALRRVSAQD